MVQLVIWVLGGAALLGAEFLPAPAPLRGGAPDPADPAVFFNRGVSVHRWQARLPVRVAQWPNGFDSGGCTLDADADGFTDLVLVRRSEGPLGELVWLRGPDYRMTQIDTGAALQDCLPATLFGRSGFLMVHRDTQVRFYFRSGGSWEVREIYSIYTASRQSGLALADVDGDGRVDIYCGNYWIQSPAAFDLPWRIFAINDLYQTPDAASFTLLALGRKLLALERPNPEAPVRLFTPPADPRQLWVETRYSPKLLDKPRAALAVGRRIWAGGASGLFVLNGKRLDSRPVHALWLAGRNVYAVSDGFISVWRK